MRTLKFKNLIEGNPKSKNYGKMVEITVPDDFDENNPSFKKAGERGAAFGKRVAAVTKHLREVESLEEVGELGRVAGRKLFKEFGNGS